MRLIAAVFFLLALAACAFAQPAGEVESIGFNNVYRPGCWTPMVVKIKANTAPSGTYLVQVKQRDLDGDVAVFTREITLTAAAAGGEREQRFWTYFIPQPVDRGLPSARDGATLRDTQAILEVYLCEEDGRQITQLPITSVPDNVDPPAGGLDSQRGVRLVLAINDGSSRPAWDELREGLAQQNRLLGVVENILFMPLRTRDLPENPLAYEAVDTIVWFDGNPTALKTDGGLRMRALESWIRAGGHLVICQPMVNPQRVIEFGELLPVRVDSVEDRADAEPLRSIAVAGRRSIQDDWSKLTGPFRVAFATPRDGAIVDVWLDPPPDESATTNESTPSTRPVEAPRATGRPYIVRRALGCGAVTWVAQDLGDPTITLTARTGWANVWNRVLDLRGSPVAGNAIQEPDQEAYSSAAGVDLGAFLNKGLESKTRVGLFIALAIGFFILYWLVAGPGVFLFLTTRKKTHLSWFGFAATALAATALTVLVVRLLLRGPPELTHVSLVRAAANEDAIIRARFGLYIPRDGPQTIELAKTKDGAAAITALPIHPLHLRVEANSAAKLEYAAPTPEIASDIAAQVVVPYRSSLKQFAAWWTGPIDRRIEGAVTIDPALRGFIDGRITNGTGRDLQNVYIAYKVVAPGRGGEDWMMYLPKWGAGITLDLLRERESIGLDRTVGLETLNVPGGERKLIGQIGVDWADYWIRDLRGTVSLGESSWDDPSGSVPRAFPMLSLFDRLPPPRASRGLDLTRVELLRRGARHLDLSNALAAGSVVVLAESADGPDGRDAPLPIALSVQGDETPGRGRLLYQFVLPATRPRVESKR